MSCIPVSHSLSTILSQVESQMEEIPVERRGSKAYQIFPEANMNDDSDSSSYPEGFLYRRERLPSIVVEPTEQREPDSGDPYRPPRCLMNNNVEEEEEEREDTSAERTDSHVEGEQQDDMGVQEGLVARKSSIGQLSRLTPPASSTPPEAAPPCLRS
ncbi:uncharacterized protein LOC116686549 isoform X1 [Etheostoma spectabile]|uniref:uncharacterized protein LOC116686549 isoform X1 n=1 Tax=Etheostoma spectabile TaxID=54343 RepID=UPI0013AEB00C|nr:uncharacterized protein LOC116686549 isoform X1 [Etheostoma spectabile]